MRAELTVGRDAGELRRKGTERDCIPVYLGGRGVQDGNVLGYGVVYVDTAAEQHGIRDDFGHRTDEVLRVLVDGLSTVDVTRGQMMVFPRRSRRVGLIEGDDADGQRHIAVIPAGLDLA